MTRKSEIGKLGEDLACEYLVKKGYKVVERNYRQRWGEIDIIGREPDGTLVFVEVKALRSGAQGLAPEDNLTATKLKKLRRTCQLFTAANPGLVREERGWRIDLVALTMSGKDCDIKHYENI